MTLFETTEWKDLNEGILELKIERKIKIECDCTTANNYESYDVKYLTTDQGYLADPNQLACLYQDGSDKQSITCRLESHSYHFSGRAHGPPHIRKLS